VKRLLTTDMPAKLIEATSDITFLYIFLSIYIKHNSLYSMGLSTIEVVEYIL
jgi:hypothetical protein